MTSGEEGGRYSYNKAKESGARRGHVEGGAPRSCPSAECPVHCQSRSCSGGGSALCHPHRPGTNASKATKRVSSWARFVSVTETSRGNSWPINELVMSWLWASCVLFRVVISASVDCQCQASIYWGDRKEGYIKRSALKLPRGRDVTFVIEETGCWFHQGIWRKRGKVEIKLFNNRNISLERVFL